MRPCAADRAGRRDWPDLTGGERAAAPVVLAPGAGESSASIAAFTPADVAATVVAARCGAARLVGHRRGRAGGRARGCCLRTSGPARGGGCAHRPRSRQADRRGRRRGSTGHLDPRVLRAGLLRRASAISTRPRFAVCSSSERRPHGVAGLITPWNFPLAIPLWKAAPALGGRQCRRAQAVSRRRRVCRAAGRDPAAPSPRGTAHRGPRRCEPRDRQSLDQVDVVSFTGSVRSVAAVAAAAGARGRPGPVRDGRPERGDRVRRRGPRPPRPSSPAQPWATPARSAQQPGG